MNRTFWLSALVTSVMLPGIGAGSVSAQQLQNPTFVTDVSNWTAASDAAVSWDPLDADTSPVSGSALVTNSSTVEVDSTGASQCLGNISEERPYEISGTIRIPSGQTTTGLAHLVVLWYGGPACSNVLDVDTSSSLLSSITNAWEPVRGVFVSPAGTQSASLSLDVLKVEDTASLRAHFDNIVFVGGIFKGAFESGDTSGWSETVGFREPPPITYISLQITPGSVLPSGGTLALLALVKDDVGWGVPNAPVHFLTEAGSLDSGGAILPTDAYGQATDTLTLTAGDINALGSRTFNVLARTVDFTGAQIEAVFQVHVQVGVPIADFTWFTNGLEVNFQNQSTGGQPLSFLWNFGDGTTSTIEHPVKIYSNPGDYTVCLTATNSVSNNTLCQTVTVSQ